MRDAVSSIKGNDFNLYVGAHLNTGPFMLSFLSVIGFLSKRDRKRET